MPPDSRPLASADAPELPDCQFTALARSQPLVFLATSGVAASTSTQPPSTLSSRRAAPAPSRASTGADASLSERNSVLRKAVTLWPGGAAGAG